MPVYKPPAGGASDLIAIVVLVASVALTAGVVGRVNSFEDGGVADPAWIAEWWAFPAISLTILVGTFILGRIFVTTAAAISFGHTVGILIAVPYAFAALEGNATPVGALVALPIAAVATLGNNSRYNVAHERAYG